MKSYNLGILKSVLAVMLVLAGAGARGQSVAHVSLPTFTNTASAVFTVTSSTGNLNVALILKNNGDVISSVTNNQGDTYVSVGCTAVGGTGGEMWYAKNAHTGITSITINRSTGTSNFGMADYDIAGASTTAPLDQYACLSSQTSTTNPVGPSITTTATSNVVIGLLCSSGLASAVAAPFTLDAVNSNGGGGAHSTNTAGTYAPSWSTGAFGWGGITASFIASVAAPKSGGLLGKSQILGKGKVF